LLLCPPHHVTVSLRSFIEVNFRLLSFGIFIKFYSKASQ